MFLHGSRFTRRAACAVLALCAGASLPGRLGAAAGEGGWTGDFSIPAFDGPVTACAVYLDRYVVAGEFRWASGSAASNVAVWSGSEWAPLGAGLPSEVRCLERWGAELVAGTDSYGPGRAPVMRFDGVTWTDVGANLYGEVDALLVDGGDLYAAGRLYLIGATNAYRVARFDGIAWAPVGDAFDGRVRTLAMYGGALYAGGEFLTAGETTVSRIARLDGAHWSALAGGTGPGGGVYVGALAVFGGRLIVGGAFDAIGGVQANGIAAWDGSAWSALPGTPADVQVRSLDVDGNLLYAAGLFQVPSVYASGLVTFDGATWSPPERYPGWTVDAIDMGGGALLAVGNFSDLYTRGSLASVERVRDVVVRDPVWRELESWQPSMRGLRGPSHTAVSALHVHGGDLYAGGYFEEAADPPVWRRAVGVARWDGAAWSPLADLGWVSALTTFDDRLVADVPGGSGVWAWTGTDWSRLGGSLPGYANTFITWDGRLCAVGGFAAANPYGVAMFNGTAWSPLGDLGLGASASLIQSAAVFSGDLYVGGDEMIVPGQGTTHMARWDGSRWHVVPDQPYFTVTSLLRRADGLWAGGLSLTATPNGAVSRWNGTDWTTVGDLNGQTWTLAELDGDVYAAGSFTVDGAPFTLVRWSSDDARWVGIPQGPNARVQIMARHAHSLYLGGSFTRAGGRPAEGLARWTPAAPAPRVSGSGVRWIVGPNPARDLVRFTVTLPAAGHVRISIFDLRGARVATPLDGVLPAGTSESPWNLRDDSGGSLRAGVYHAKIESESGTSSGRIVVVR